MFNDTTHIAEHPAQPLASQKICEKLGVDIRRLIMMMSRIAYANMVFGIINVIAHLLVNTTSYDLLVTGLLSIFTYFLVRMKISFINGSKSWIEISVTSVCGLYLPIFVLAVTISKLVLLFFA